MPIKIDETGSRYGKLQVLGPSVSLGAGARWTCCCDCGLQTTVRGIDLRSGNTSSCGCSHYAYIDETGNKYGKYTVLRRAETAEGPSRAVRWLCECECGKMKSVRGEQLRTGQANSCGQCHRPYLISKTGFSQHLLYDIWSSMMSRCHNENNPAFPNYGGRGIQVYLDWQSSPSSFYDWIEQNLGTRSEGHSLDRINVYGNYEPGNLKWSNPQEQVNNRRLVLLSEEEYELITKMRKGDSNSEHEKLCVGA